MLGFIGVVLGVPLNIDSGNIMLLGVSLFGLTAGTLYLKRFCTDVPPFESTCVQIIGGALAAIILMRLFEIPHLRWSAGFIGAMAWNTLAMSIFGMAIYNLMLDRYGAGQTSAGFFLVPGASALMAWTLLDEHLSILAMSGLIASTVGVALVWWRSSRQARGTPSATTQQYDA